MAFEQIRKDVREIAQEITGYHELLLSVTRRDLVVRYKQTVMGLGWAVMTPVANMLLFTVIFTRVAPLETEQPYPIFAYVGLLPWNLLASSLRLSALSLVNNAPLVTKVYFPREVFPFSTVMLSLVDFAIASLVLVVLMLWYGFGVGWTVLFLPVVLLVQLLFTMAMALLLAMATLFYRDVKYVFEIGLSLWMFATPVVYPVDRIGGRLETLFHLNPMTPIIRAYRQILLEGTLPPAGPFLAVACFSAVFLCFCWIFFHRCEFRFAENV